MESTETKKPLSLQEVRREREQAPDVGDLYEAVRGSIWFLALFPLLITAATAAYAFLVMPPAYESRSSIIPLENESAADSALTDFLDPLPLTLEISSRDESRGIMAFLESNRLKETLIRKHDLLPHLYPDKWDAERGAWKVPEDEIPSVVYALQDEAVDEVYSVENDSDAGLIRLSWQCRQPALCAQMLGSVLGELTTFLERDYVSDARRNREFLEQQVERAAAEVRRWESAVPGSGISAAAIAREFEAAKTVYVELRRRLALARIAESERRPDFKVLDEAYVPETWDKLPRIIAVALAFMAALALALVMVFGRRFLIEVRGERKHGA
mgnify:CR=1 FL=1